MKRFKEFVTELFDTTVKYKHKKGYNPGHHIYSFTVNNVPYNVNIHHMGLDKKKAEVDFTDTSKPSDENMSTTGSQREHVGKVFGAVKQIMADHGRKHGIERYYFQASNEKEGGTNPSRKKAYLAMARRLGGSGSGTSFTVPSPHLKESEDNGKPVRIKLRGMSNVAGKSDDFLDEYHSTTHEHPFDSRSRVHDEGATTELSRDGSDGIHMHDIRSLTPGGGSKTLENLKALADKHGVKISGTAKAYSQSSKYPMDTEKLAGWYKKRGFSVGDGDKYDGYEVSYSPKSVKEEFDPEAVKIANSTSRNSGAVGAKAITPRYVESVAKSNHKILDFGSGKDAAHAKRLREKGFDVTAHEFGSNQNENHDKDALNRQYDHVYASNVLNVQSSKEMMGKTLDQIHGAVKKGGSFTGNFPESPRKAEDIDASHVENELKNRFEVVKRVGGSKKAPLFHASNPK